MEKGNKIIKDNNMYYTQTHEWVKKIAENKWQIGITDHAQHHLKDIYAIDLPKVGTDLKQFEPWGQIESEKGASELCSPISGKVVKINKDNLGEIYDEEEPNPDTIRLGGDLNKINQEPYATWLIEIEGEADPEILKKLLNAEEYEKHLN